MNSACGRLDVQTLRPWEAKVKIKCVKQSRGKEKKMQNIQNHVKKALIIGSGIAGPALALFLTRAGIDTEIYEAREAPEGYALSLSCNGVAVLAELGLDRAAFAEGSAVT